MKPRTLPLVLISFLTFSNALFAIDLQKEMTNDEFTAAGLSKLSPEEIRRLEAWLNQSLDNTPNGRAQSAGENSSPEVAQRPQADAMPDAFPPVAQSAKPTAFESEIVGDFDQFRGKGTRIELANGQVWEQTDNTSSSKVRTKNIRVKPTFLGHWRMQLKDNNVFANVKRIK